MNSPVERSDNVSTDPHRQQSVERFLYREADLLDSFELETWLDLLTPEFTLTVPVQTTREPGAEESNFSDVSNYMKEDYAMIRERVGRLSKEYAWSENPRSRIRHVLGNVQILADNGDELTVSNNQHVYRSYGDTPDHDLLSARRETVLRPTDDAFEIDERTVYLDHSILNTRNLTLPLL